MIRLEVDTDRREVTIHADDDGMRLLAQAAQDAMRPAKVFLGDPGEPMLILRHEDYEP